MIIRDILNIKGNTIFSVGPQGALSEAVSLMVKSDVGSLVVMGGERMVGMITFREVLAALDNSGGSLGKLTVADVMVKDPIFGTPQDTVDYVRGVMVESHVRYLPVKEGDSLIGVISFHDVARAALNEANFENRLLKRFIKHSSE